MVGDLSVVSKLLGCVPYYDRVVLDTTIFISGVVNTFSDESTALQPSSWVVRGVPYTNWPPKLPTIGYLISSLTTQLISRTTNPDCCRNPGPIYRLTMTRPDG